MNTLEKYKYVTNSPNAINDTDDTDAMNITDEQTTEEYVFQAKICKRLSKELGLEETDIDENIKLTDVPTQHGLINSDVIIPSYYQLYKHPENILRLDYLNIIKDDIRNLRQLNIYELEFIKKLNDDDKFEIICMMNENMKYILSMLDQDHSFSAQREFL